MRKIQNKIEGKTKQGSKIRKIRQWENTQMKLFENEEILIEYVDYFSHWWKFSLLYYVIKILSYFRFFLNPLNIFVTNLYQSRSFYIFVLFVLLIFLFMYNCYLWFLIYEIRRLFSWKSLFMNFLIYLFDYLKSFMNFPYLCKLGFSLSTHSFINVFYLFYC